MGYCWNNSGSNYSTTELNTCNTWIDGKNIYKKTISIPAGTWSNNSSALVHINHRISDLETVLNVSGMFKWCGGSSGIWTDLGGGHGYGQIYDAAQFSTQIDSNDLIMGHIVVALLVLMVMLLLNIPKRIDYVKLNN